MAFGPDLTVIAPEPDPAFLSLPVRLERRAYRPGELRGAFLVLAATDDEEVNRAIAAEARARGALANNASDCRDCDFFFPAVVLTEELTLGPHRHRGESPGRERGCGQNTGDGAMRRCIRIGRRESRLAVVQTRLVADYIQEALPEAEVRLVTMKTTETGFWTGPWRRWGERASSSRSWTGPCWRGGRSCLCTA